MAVTHAVHLAMSWEGEAEAVRNNLLFEVEARRFKITQLVWCDSTRDGPQVVLDSPLVWHVGQAYSDPVDGTLGNDENLAATCVKVTPRQAGPMMWLVDAHFDTQRITNITTDNPLAQLAEVRWTGVKVERPLVRDTTGVPVLNSSREMHDPGVTYEETRPLLTVIRNEATFTRSWAVGFQDTLNESPFLGFAPLCAKVNNIDGVKMRSNGVTFWQVTYVIEFRRESFAYLVLDQWFRDASGKLFRDPVDNAPLSSPTLLNGRGARRTDFRMSLDFGVDSEQEFIFPYSNVGDSLYTVAPPGSEPLVGGWMPSGDYYFDIRIDNEIMRVTNAKPLPAPPSPWFVIRGVAGSVRASHSIGAKIYLEPYYKRYLPFKTKDFDELELESDVGD